MEALQRLTEEEIGIQAVELDNIDGLDEEEVYSEGWGGKFPLDAYYIRTSYKTVREVVDRINDGRLKLDPDFQRAFVWKQYKQSKLIESCIMRVPLPVFYSAESKGGDIIVDGLQRLSSFRDYLNNSFKLSFRSIDSETSRNLLEGKKFEDLRINHQERIEDTSLTFYIIDQKAPISAKFDIFDRVNSGVPLTRQQMRNALFCGPATKWVKSIVETPAFLSATGKSLNSQLMRDREAVNRFVSFKLIGWENYTGDMNKFLADGLSILEEYSEKELQQLKKNFVGTMEFCQDLFGEHTFRKSLFAEDEKKSLLNMSLFDVMSVTFSDNLNGLSGCNYDKIRNCIKNMITIEKFEDSITKGTNSKKAVAFRFKKFNATIRPLVDEEFA